jgi:hypothetical protein
MLTPLNEYADTNHCNFASWALRSRPIITREMATDVAFALCRIYYSSVKGRIMLIRTLTIMANVQVMTKATDFNVLFLRFSWTGAIDVLKFSDFTSSEISVTGAMSEHVILVEGKDSSKDTCGKLDIVPQFERSGQVKACHYQ